MPSLHQATVNGARRTLTRLMRASGDARDCPRSRTLAHLRAHLEKRGANVQICTLLNKVERRVVDVDCKYVGFQVCV